VLDEEGLRGLLAGATAPSETSAAAGGVAAAAPRAEA
jgi:hypothetical protein